MSDQSDTQGTDESEPSNETQPSQEGQDGATETEQVDTGSTTEGEGGE